MTSFLGGGALSRNGSVALHPISYVTGAVALFVAVSLLTLAMLLPYTMRFSISAAAILVFVDAAEPEPMSPEEALREVALRYERMYDLNASRIRWLVGCFEVAIVCLLGEVAFWIAVLVEGRT